MPGKGVSAPIQDRRKEGNGEMSFEWKGIVGASGLAELFIFSEEMFQKLLLSKSSEAPQVLLFARPAP